MNYKLNEDDIYNEFIDEKNYKLLKFALGGEDFNFKKIYHKTGPDLKGEKTVLEFYDRIAGRENLLYFIEISAKPLQQIGFYHKLSLSRDDNFLRYRDKDSFILEFDTNKVFLSKRDQYDSESFRTNLENFFCISRKSKKGYEGIMLSNRGDFSYDKTYSYEMTSSHCGLNCSNKNVTDFIVYQIEEIV